MALAEDQLRWDRTTRGWGFLRPGYWQDKNGLRFDIGWFLAQRSKAGTRRVSDQRHRGLGQSSGHSHSG